MVMKLEEFHIGDVFSCGGKRWRCTDIGTRVVVAICLEPHKVTHLEIDNNDPGIRTESNYISDDPSWFNGPPYPVVETVFDEHDMDGCSVTP